MWRGRCRSNDRAVGRVCIQQGQQMADCVCSQGKLQQIHAGVAAEAGQEAEPWHQLMFYTLLSSTETPAGPGGVLLWSMCHYGECWRWDEGFLAQWESLHMLMARSPTPPVTGRLEPGLSRGGDDGTPLLLPRAGC